MGGGTPTNLYSFDGPHGENPCGSLTLSADGSTLYGTTGWGGNMSLNNGFGDGNVFSLPVGGGTPTTLFNCGGILGEHPLGSLTLSADGSTLYGMTQEGGANGDGTVFSIPVGGGTPTTLLSFDGTDGMWPGGSLTLSGSTLYGMTSAGGANNMGTVFSIPVGGGAPTVLHTFDGTDGIYPYGSLTLSGSTLYGMTFGNQLYNEGTVFALTVPEPSTIALLLAGAACLLAFAWRRRTA